jgi:hypothetical protein
LETIQKMKTNPDFFKKIDIKNHRTPSNFNRETVGSKLPIVGRWWKKKTLNHEALTERFKERFPTGESLFNCTVEQITEVVGTE